MVQIRGDMSAAGQNTVPQNLAISKRTRKIGRSSKGYLVYLGSVTASKADCSQEIKRRLKLGRAAMKELGKIIESKDVSFQTKAKIIHTLVFSMPMYRCKS